MVHLFCFNIKFLILTFIWHQFLLFTMTGFGALFLFLWMYKKYREFENPKMPGQNNLVNQAKPKDVPGRPTIFIYIGHRCFGLIFLTDFFWSSIRSCYGFEFLVLRVYYTNIIMDGQNRKQTKICYEHVYQGARKLHLPEDSKSRNFQ